MIIKVWQGLYSYSCVASTDPACRVPDAASIFVTYMFYFSLL